MTTSAKQVRDDDGFYPDDISEIVANANPQKREMLRLIGKAIVTHDRYFAAWDWLKDVMMESGTASESTYGLFYGESGVGKSTILRRFCKKFGGPYETRAGTMRPVVRVATPSDPNLGNILTAILSALEADELIMGKNPDKKRAVLAQLKKQQVKLLVFDEFSNLIEDRTDKFAKKALRELKEMLSEGRSQIVFAGTPDIVGLQTIYKQFKRRSGGDFPITAFDLESDLDIDEWEELLKDINDDVLPIPCHIALHHADMSRKLHKASNGVIDNLMKLLLRATSIAYDYEEKVLEESTLAEAFERLRRGDADATNPFGEPRSRVRRARVVIEEDDDDESGLWNRGPKVRATFTK